VPRLFEAAAAARAARVTGLMTLPPVPETPEDARPFFRRLRDLATYLDAADASQLRLRAGEAAVFFPVDVHMPSLRVGAEPALVRKSVVKVPVG
jgi:YhcH/YjgK/YiaL family protein